ncbi:MAG: YihY/virulence factor BrkB family protein [Acidimicrobiia bacterium]
MAEAPGPEPAPGPLTTARTLAARTARDSLEDRVPGLAAEISFYTVLSLPPMLLVVLGSLGFVTGWLGPETAADIRTEIIDAAATFLSEATIDDLVAPAVDGLLQRGRLDILTIGAVTAVWSASRAVRVVVDAITIAYDRAPKRNWWQRRVVALALTVAGIISAVVLLPLLVVGPRAGAALSDGLGLGSVFQTAWQILYWPVVAAIGLVVLTWIYHLVEPESPWRWELPGAVLAMALWAAGSFGLRFYATTFVEGDSAYGIFAAPLVVLLWVYLSAIAVLVGAELNAEIDKMFLAAPETTDA